MRNKTQSVKLRLEDYRDDISRCVRCGACSAVCPSFLADRRESRSPRGRIALIQACLDGRIKTSDLYIDRLATCTECLACESTCGSGVPVGAIILAAKEQAVREAGHGIIEQAAAVSLNNPVIMRSLAWLAPAVLHFSGAAVKGSRIDNMNREALCKSRIEATPKNRVVFFPGCAVKYFQHDVLESAAAVIKAAEYEVIIPNEIKCCGKPFLSLGDRNTAKKIAAENTKILSGFAADAIVTACPSCSLMFKRDYADLLAQSGMKLLPVLDIHQFLVDRFSKLSLAHPPLRATWHDPCHLGRGQGLAGAARQVLGSIAGLDLVEMREPDRCCGFGGIMRATHPALSQKIGEAKAADIAETKASIVITGCPGCAMQISDALGRAGLRIPVMHTVQIVENAIKTENCKAGAEQIELILNNSQC